MHQTRTCDLEYNVNSLACRRRRNPVSLDQEHRVIANCMRQKLLALPHVSDVLHQHPPAEKKCRREDCQH